MRNLNTILLIAVGVFILYLATSGKLSNVGPAWNVLMGNFPKAA